MLITSLKMFVEEPSFASLSFVLGRAFGLYLVLMSLWAFTHSKRVAQAEKEFKGSALSQLFLGSSALFFGALFVSLHSSMAWGLPLLVTLLGILMLAKGILVLFFPALFDRLFSSWARDGLFITMSSLLGLVGGGFLLWYTWMPCC